MKSTYRPEIDGLRAIAVCAVILYHSKITILGHLPFEGGFIGVDIFFVISGYLIGLIILKELISTGSFSFKNFYERRIRRILPAILLVMSISLPLAFVYLSPIDLINFSKSILYSLGFVSNFYFHYSGQLYGATDGLYKPFLHTWSLSIEEQFYILFPITLVFLFKYLRKYLIHILIFFFLGSLSVSDYTSRNYSSISFYFFHTRIWELLIGCIIAYYEIIKGHRSKNEKLNSILPAIGLFLIGYSILFFNDQMFHPSFYSFLPVMGVCLFIWFSNDGEITSRVLSTKLFVYIGLISYSLYLWHYPIFSFSRITEFHRGSLFNKTVVVIIILTLSILTYHFVERPFRNKKNNFKFLLRIILIGLAILFIFNLSIVLKKIGGGAGFIKNNTQEKQENLSFSHTWSLLKDSNNQVCMSKMEGCKFNTSSNKKVYIVGDSHMASLSYDLKNRLVERKFQFISLTNNCGIYFPGFNFINTKTNQIDKICNDRYFNKVKETLLKEKNSIIIFGGRFPVFLSGSYFDNHEGGVEGGILIQRYFPTALYNTIQDSFKNEVIKLSEKNKIILIYPLPEVGLRGGQFYSNLESLRNVTTSYQVFKKRTKSSFDLLDSIQNKNIYRIYPHLLFCNTIVKGRCITHNNKDIFYNDSNHPSLKGAELINNLILNKIKNINSNVN